MLGASLAKIVLSPTWAQRLRPQARTLFAHMAITAKDTDQPPLYFGGRDQMVAVMLGDLKDVEKQRQDQYRYVSRLLREITAAGGITRRSVAVKGVFRTAYELAVLPSLVDESSTPAPRLGGRIVHTQGDESSTGSAAVGTNRPHSVDDLTIPRKKEEPLEQEPGEDPTRSGHETYVAAYRSRFGGRS